MRKTGKIIICALFPFMHGLTEGAVTLDPCYQSGMILQRGQAVHVSGSAADGETVVVACRGNKAETIAREGRWSIELPPMTASAIPVTMKVNDHTLTDILFGDVWVAAGQSNMFFPLEKSLNKESLAPEEPIRFYHQELLLHPKAVIDESNVEVARSGELFRGSWIKLDPSIVSAVAYYFAQSLHRETGIPIGILQVAVGGSPTETFVSRSTLLSSPDVADSVLKWPTVGLQPAQLDSLRNVFSAYLEPGEGFRLRGPKLHHPREPGMIFEKGIKPLANLRISGAIWYQGEANVKKIDSHGKVFKMLVQDFRDNWNAPDLRFLYVQLPAISRGGWNKFRPHQLWLLNIPNTQMAVTIDTGMKRNVHPPEKRPIGERLAWLARNPGARLTGPVLKDIGEEPGTLVLQYTEPVRSADGQPIRGFEVTAGDGVFIPATATIDGNRVILKHDLAEPTVLRYAFVGFPEPWLNLIDGKGWPATPFVVELRKKHKLLKIMSADKSQAQSVEGRGPKNGTQERQAAAPDELIARIMDKAGVENPEAPYAGYTHVPSADLYVHPDATFLDKHSLPSLRHVTPHGDAYYKFTGRRMLVSTDLMKWDETELRAEDGLVTKKDTWATGHFLAPDHILMLFLERATKRIKFTPEGHLTRDSAFALYCVESRDRGKSWQNRQLLEGGLTGSASLCQLPTGRLVVCSQQYSFERRRYVLHIKVSDDKGQTWRQTQELDGKGEGTHAGYASGQVAWLSGKRLLLVFRTEDDVIGMAVSDDAGETFELRDSGIEASSSAVFLSKLPSGQLVLAYNACAPQLLGTCDRNTREAYTRWVKQLKVNRKQVYSVRKQNWFRAELLLRVSDDEGKTWGEPLLLAHRASPLHRPLIRCASPTLFLFGKELVVTSQEGLKASLPLSHIQRRSRQP